MRTIWFLNYLDHLVFFLSSVQARLPLDPLTTTTYKGACVKSSLSSDQNPSRVRQLKGSLNHYAHHSKQSEGPSGQLYFDAGTPEALFSDSAKAHAMTKT